MKYEQMTDDELRLEIEIAKGNWIKHPRGWYSCKQGRKIRKQDAIDWLQPNEHCKKTDYPCNLNDAWELVEEMRQDTAVNLVAYGKSVTPAYSCSMNCRPWNGWDNSPARAICIAYLQWKSQQEATK